LTFFYSWGQRFFTSMVFNNTSKIINFAETKFCVLNRHRQVSLLGKHKTVRRFAFT